MKSSQLARRLALVAGGASLVAMGTLAVGCGTSTKEEPATTPTTSAPDTSAPSPSSPAPLTPTEKAVGPGGDNSFSPTINPVPPGSSCTSIVNGVCQR
jgi:hypothetical protein